MASKRGPKPGINWATVEAAYLAGGVTYRQLADKYGVSERTVERHASKGSWESRRRDVAAQVSGELPGKVADVVLDDNAAMLAAHHGIWERVKARAYELMDETEYVVGGMSGDIVLDENGKPLKRRIVRTAGHLKDLAAVFKAATEGQRLARNLPDPKDQSGNLGGKEGPQAGVVELPALEPAPEPPPDEPED